MDVTSEPSGSDRSEFSRDVSKNEVSGFDNDYLTGKKHDCITNRTAIHTVRNKNSGYASDRITSLHEP